MKFQFTVDYNDKVADIQTMREMPVDGYSNYIANDLLFLDHHGVLRSDIGQYPLATSPEQVEALVEYLKGIAAKMRGA